MSSRSLLLLALACAASGCSALLDTDGLAGERPRVATKSIGAEADAAPAPAEGTPDATSAPTPTPTPAPAATREDAGSTSPRAYSAAVLEDHPVLYLPLDEPAGSTTVTDAARNLQPTLIGSPTFGRPGAIAGDPGTAAAFTNSGIDCGPVFDFVAHQNYSLELWARIPSAVTEQRYLFRKGATLADGGPPPEGYSVFLTAATDTTRIVFSRRTGGLAQPTDVLLKPSDGFRHVVAVANGNSVQLFVDGALLGTDVGDGFASTISGSFFIGLRNPLAGFANTELDEIAVYDYALPPERIQLHHALGAGP